MGEVVGRGIADEGGKHEVGGRGDCPGGLGRIGLLVELMVVDCPDGTGGINPAVGTKKRGLRKREDLIPGETKKEGRKEVGPKER